MDAFVARFPVDQSVEVFYDPENPGRNCLDREDRGGLLPLWVGAALAVICTALLAWGGLTISKNPAFGVAKVDHNYMTELLRQHGDHE